MAVAMHCNLKAARRRASRSGLFGRIVGPTMLLRVKANTILLNMEHLAATVETRTN